MRENKLFFALPLFFAASASSDVASSVTTVATDASTTISSVIGAIAPVVFLVVVAVVAIGAGKKLLSKGGGGYGLSSPSEDYRTWETRVFGSHERDDSVTRTRYSMWKEAGGGSR